MFFEIIILFLYLLAFETLVLFNGKAFNYFLLLSLNFDILKTSFWVKFLHAWTDVETKFGLMVLILLFCFIFHDKCVCVFFGKINLLSTETRMYQFVKNEEKSCYKSTMVLISSYLSYCLMTKMVRAIYHKVNKVGRNSGHEKFIVISLFKNVKLGLLQLLWSSFTIQCFEHFER